MRCDLQASDLTNNFTTLLDISTDKGNYGIAASAVAFSPDLPTYLRITDINDDGTVNFEGLKSVDDVNANKYYLSPNDIVFARTGASTGRNYFYDGKDGKFVYAGFLIKFSIDPQKINPKFVKYYCQSKKYYDWIASFNTGSTRGNINAQTLANMPIPILTRKQQDLLVATLSCLDDKIELNNQMNKTLEAQAQAIFKSWFVDFEPWGGIMPEDWREGNLGEISIITMGQSPKGDTYNEDGNGTVFYQGRAEFGARFPTRRLFTTEPNRMAIENDILLSVRAPVGDYNIANESCCIGRGLAAIKPQEQAYGYCICLMAELQPKFKQFNGEGTVFGSINKDSLNNLNIIIPTDETLLEFEKIVSPLNNQIRFNHNSTQILTALRDTLLPKLMSGEIKVKEVE